MNRRDFSHCLDDSHLAGIELARGYFEEISYRADELLVKGWILLPTTAFDSVQVLVDGQQADEAAVIGRDDVASALPQIPHADRSGFRFQLKWPAVNRSRIDIVGVEGGRARGCLSTLFRPDLDTAVPTPPAELMERVASTRDPMFFKIGGLKSYGEFLRPIERYRSPRPISRMLDWGCGSGRVTAHFLLDPEAGAVHGCDIDAEAVAWCRLHLAPGDFRTVQPLPPTPYDSDSFDLVIGFSVFTHLSRELQHAWLSEMQRVIAPGGLFLATTHGSFAAHFERRSDSPNLLRDGILDDITDHSLDGIAPQGYYRGVFQTREYTVREWSRYFEIVEYIERGMNFQDLVVMRRRPKSLRRLSSMFRDWFRTYSARPAHRPGRTIMMSMSRLSAVLLFVVTATVAPARGQAPDYLNILWRVQLGGQDYMSTVSSSERGFFPSEGQIFYLYTEKVPGTVKVHRLYGVGDHMDSLWSEEGSDATAEFPGIYLRSNFNRFWTYIANTDDLNEVGVPLACPPGPGSLATELTSG